MTINAISPEILLRAYAAGIFPMAERRDDPEIHWVDPRRRGILPLDGFHISRSLRRTILRSGWRVTADTAFAATVEACADRDETWINDTIFALYVALHRSGHAHSIELWEGDQMIGGVYGVTLGTAYFGESMFSRRTDASKAALAHAVHRLRAGGFTLFDTQFLTPHLRSLGGIEIPRADYHRRLAAALQGKATFHPPGYSPSPSEVVSSPAERSGPAPSGSEQRNTQTS
jgi:leucyl/phenylalanyl-tRNA--protein transferase